MTDARYYKHPKGYDVPSVTTIGGLLAKPALIQWAANCAVEHVRGHWLTDKVEFIDQARFAYKEKSKTATEFGLHIHKLCEAWLNGKKDWLEQLWDESTEDQKKLFEAFMAWSTKHNVNPIVTEQVVYGDDYAGRIDLVCEIDSFWMTKGWCTKRDIEWRDWMKKQRKIVLIDFKTGKGAYYDEWGYQTAAYRKAYNYRQTTGAVNQHGVLKFNKETLKVNYKDYTNSYEKDFTIFDHLCKIYWLTDKKLKGVK